jgi:iron complex transport system ATP-binding protein
MNYRQIEVLVLDSLVAGYGSGTRKKPVLPALNASANSGELIAVIGRNGIGKSTLLRTIAGLQPPLGGNIVINGRNIRSFTRLELARETGYISTESVKVSNMTVYDLVALGRFPHTNWMGNIDAANKASILYALELTSMSGFRDRFINEISDGERQKAMIARVIAQDAAIMIMDEPTAYLDAGSRFEILHLLNALAHEKGKTIIFSTHDLHAAVNQADRIWLISGNTLEEGAPEDLMSRGSFDNLFNASNGRFNPESGTFSFTSPLSGTVYVEGKMPEKIWIEKALRRLGFAVTEVITDPFIRIETGDKEKYKLISGSSTKNAESIYDLVNLLKSNIRTII